MDRFSGWVRYFLPIALGALFLLPLILGYLSLQRTKEEQFNRQAWGMLSITSTALNREMSSVEDKLRWASKEPAVFLKHYLAEWEYQTKSVEKPKEPLKPGSLPVQPKFLATPSTEPFRLELRLGEEGLRQSFVAELKGTSDRRVAISPSALLGKITRSHPPTAFNSVLLATTDGKTLAQTAKTPLALLNLQDLIALSNAKQEKLNSIAWNEPQGLGRVDDKNPVRYQPSPLVNLKRIEVEIGSSPHYLYLTPTKITIVEIDANGAEVPVDLLLVGVVEQQEVKRIISAIPTPWITGVIIAILMMLGILWPIVRLATMSPKERLTPRSVAGMAFGAFGALILMAVLTLNLGFRISLDQRTEIRLHALADRLERNASAEIYQAICSLKHVGDIVKSEVNAQQRELTLKDIANHSVDFASSCFCEEFISQKMEKREKQPSASAATQSKESGGKTVADMFQLYPFWEHIILLGQDPNELIQPIPSKEQRYLEGESVIQVAKITSRGVVTPLRPFSRDDYTTMNSLRTGRGPYHIRDSGNEQNLEFALEPLFSPTTGEFLTLLGMREEVLNKIDSGRKQQESSGMTNLWSGLHHRHITTRFRSLTDVSMPEGFKFAVVEPSGKVLFHSDSFRNLNENFFTACRNANEFRAAASSRSEVHLDGFCGGEEYSFFLRPLFPLQRDTKIERFPGLGLKAIHGIDWILLVYRENAYVETLQYEAGASSVTLFAELLLLIAIVGFLVRLARVVIKRESSSELYSWLDFRNHWPNSNRSQHYAVVSILSALAFAVVFLILRFAPRNASTLSFYLCIIFLTCLILIRYIVKSKWQRLKLGAHQLFARNSILMVYSTHIGLFCFCAIFSLMLIFFRVSLDETLRQHRALNRSHAIQQFHERFERSKSEVAQLELQSEEIEDDILWARINSPLDLYDVFIGSDMEQRLKVAFAAPANLARIFAKPLVQMIWHSDSGSKLNFSNQNIAPTDSFPASDLEAEALVKRKSLPNQEHENLAVGDWPVMPTLMSSEGFIFPYVAIANYSMESNDLKRFVADFKSDIARVPEFSLKSTCYYIFALIVTFALGWWLSIIVRSLFAKSFEGRSSRMKSFRDLETLLGFATTRRNSDSDPLLGMKSEAAIRLVVFNQPLTGASARLRILLRSREDVSYIDFSKQCITSSDESIDEQFRKLNTERLKKSSLVILDNLEFRIDDGAVNLLKLRIIEALTSNSDMGVIILTTVDPISFPASQAITHSPGSSVPDRSAQGENEKSTPKQEERASVKSVPSYFSKVRWSRVLSAYQWVNYQPYPELDWGKNDTFREAVEALLHDSASPKGAPPLGKWASDVYSKLEEAKQLSEKSDIAAALNGIVEHIAKGNSGVDSEKKSSESPNSTSSIRSWKVIGFVIITVMVLLSLLDYRNRDSLELVSIVIWLLCLRVMLLEVVIETVTKIGINKVRLAASVVSLSTIGLCSSVFSEAVWATAICKVLVILWMTWGLAWLLLQWKRALNDIKESVLSRGTNENRYGPFRKRLQFAIQQKNNDALDVEAMRAVVRKLAIHWQYLSHDPVFRDEQLVEDSRLHNWFKSFRRELNCSDFLKNPHIYLPLIKSAISEARKPLRDPARELVQDESDSQIAEPFDFSKAKGDEPALLKMERSLVREIRELCEGYFYAIWNTSTKDERLVMFQLAADGWINPKNVQVINQLIKRRLLFVSEGRYYLMSTAFADFVKDVQSPAEIQEWIAEEKASLWYSLRVGAYSVLAFSLLFLWQIRPDLFESYSSGFIALAGGTLTIFRLYAHFADRLGRRKSLQISG